MPVSKSSTRKPTEHHKKPKDTTGWHITLFPTSSWHQNKGWVSEHGPHTKTELLFWCQWEVWTNMMCHPVVQAQNLPQHQMNLTICSARMSPTSTRGSSSPSTTNRSWRAAKWAENGANSSRPNRFRGAILKWCSHTGTRKEDKVHCPPLGCFAGFVNKFLGVPLTCSDSREAA